MARIHQNLVQISSRGLVLRKHSGSHVMTRLIALLFVLFVCDLALAAPKLVITEIQYDPSSEESDDQQTEWVEIQNVGAESVNLKGYQLTSGSKAKPHDAKQRFVLGEISIAPGAYM